MFFAKAKSSLHLSDPCDLSFVILSFGSFNPQLSTTHPFSLNHTLDFSPPNNPQRRLFALPSTMSHIATCTNSPQTSPSLLLSTPPPRPTRSRRMDSTQAQGPIIPPRSHLRSAAEPSSSSHNSNNNINNMTLPNLSQLSLVPQPSTPATPLPASPSGSSVSSASASGSYYPFTSPGLPVTPGTPPVYPIAENGIGHADRAGHGGKSRSLSSKASAFALSDILKKGDASAASGSGTVTGAGAGQGAGGRRSKYTRHGSLSASGDPMRVRDGLIPRASPSGVYTRESGPRPMTFLSVEREHHEATLKKKHELIHPYSSHLSRSSRSQ